jgi:2-polyprenyl-3-methyl-5-hydroxy-6-metoxy-1,4-benzoquinol methylase
MPDLTSRRVEPEWMDQPDLDPESHRQALEGLRRINRLSGSAALVWRAIHALALQTGRNQLRVLDVACGGGDVAIALWRKARCRGIDLEILGCDQSPVAVGLATARAADARAGARFEQFDVLAGPLPAGYDVVMTSLFVHHLSEADAVKLLNSMAHAAGHLLLVHDLRRSTAGFWLAQVICRAATRSPIVHADGPQSVRAAFTAEELGDLCRRAGLQSARVEHRWPFRLLVAWRR